MWPSLEINIRNMENWSFGRTDKICYYGHRLWNHMCSLA